MGVGIELLIECCFGLGRTSLWYPLPSFAVPLGFSAAGALVWFGAENFSYIKQRCLERISRATKGRESKKESRGQAGMISLVKRNFAENPSKRIAKVGQFIAQAASPAILVGIGSAMLCIIVTEQSVWVSLATLGIALGGLLIGLGWRHYRHTENKNRIQWLTAIGSGTILLVAAKITQVIIRNYYSALGIEQGDEVNITLHDMTRVGLDVWPRVLALSTLCLAIWWIVYRRHYAQPVNWLIAVVFILSSFAMPLGLKFDQAQKVAQAFTDVTTTSMHGATSMHGFAIESCMRVGSQ